MSNYLIELSAIHLALLLGYCIFLRKERQYAKMRFYLIGSTLLAIAIPLFKLPKLFPVSREPMNAVPMEAIGLDAGIFTPVDDLSGWNYHPIIGMYLAGSIFFLFKFLISVLYLIYLERKSSHERFNDLYVRRVPNIRGSFTFFNWIFLSDEINKDQQDYLVILKHEKAHASLGHSYDLIFFELFKVCFWWLPTAWFINKEIRKIHEYQADAYALKSYNIDQYSTILISSALKSNGLHLASSFHDDLILKRLIVMKQQTKNISPWKLAALCSLCVILFVVFACSEERYQETDEVGTQHGTNQSKMEGEVFTIVEELPEFEGGMDAFYRYVIHEMTYPIQARLKGVEGRVDVQFVVEKDGALSNVKAIKGIGEGCDSEAVRVVQNAPSFKPGIQRGKPVRVRMVMPIIFKLNEGKTNQDNSTQGIVVVEKAESKNGKLRVEASYASGEWSGTVYDEEGDGLPGANILVAGTTTGTVSDFNGNFKVTANQSNDLHISFVGYESVSLEGK